MAAILPKICRDMPAATNEHTYEWEHIKNLKLADPHFCVAESVHMLLGADVVPNILRHSRLAGQPGKFSAINTIFLCTLISNVQSDTFSLFAFLFFRIVFGVYP